MSKTVAFTARRRNAITVCLHYHSNKKTNYMKGITPFLWFDGNAEEAVDFYMSVFKDSSKGQVLRAGPDGPVITIAFTLNGQDFVALNGGPQYKFTEAVSFCINCNGQEEVDYYWNKLTEGGEEQPCAWLKDKFGLSWQVVPAQLPALLSNPDPAKAQRAMQAMLKMKKIDIATLENA